VVFFKHRIYQKVKTRIETQQYSMGSLGGKCFNEATPASARTTCFDAIKFDAKKFRRYKKSFNDGT